MYRLSTSDASRLSASMNLPKIHALPTVIASRPKLQVHSRRALSTSPTPPPTSRGIKPYSPKPPPHPLHRPLELLDVVVSSSEGLLPPNHKAKVIQVDWEDAAKPYRVSFLPAGSTSPVTPWFGTSEIELADHKALINPPEEPESNECCGSSCINCCWSVYFLRIKEYEERKGGAKG